MTTPTNAPDRLADEPCEPEIGLALSLSGGGYRAMLFHAGVIVRLNELGLLRRLARISSVSGGSIIAGRLGAEWPNLQFNAAGTATNLFAAVIRPIRDFAGVTVDEGAIIGGILTPGTSISDKVVAAYRKHLFGNLTLQDLPEPRVNVAPRFVLNATNVQTGTLWRFSRPYMADYSVGMIRNPDLPLAVAVAASSAFPPFLSPLIHELDPAAFDPDVPPAGEFADAADRSRMVLSDGGVYDNLGIETNWKRYRHLLVSDAGQKMGGDPHPKTDWALHSKRVLDVIDNQVRSLRKRAIVAAFENPQEVHKGAYWSIRADLDKYPVRRDTPADRAIKAACGRAQTLALAAIPTRLARVSEEEKDHLGNWGYAACDAGVRAWCAGFLAETYGVTATPPAGFPFPGGVADVAV
ncbi:MAG TPA: patatin-like phospholipase family protein [Opitutaceae bacterium]|nr:patatin-like phospholipase family protein [Opitutaceae bacterium]